MRILLLQLICLIVLGAAGCQPPSDSLPPVEPGNKAFVPEDESPLGITSTGTFRLVSPPEEPTLIEYSGTSN